MTEPPAKKQKVENSASDTPNSAKGITETDVGITEYLSPGIAGFNGTLKQRYTDFQVNEISLDGSIHHLIDLGLPQKEQTKQNDGNDSRTRKFVPELTEDHRQQLTAVLGEQTVADIIALFNTGTKLETKQAIEDKDDRTKLHQLIREAFGSRLETRTTPDNKFIVTLATSRSRQPGNRLDTSHMGAVKPFVRFLIYKENKETMEVANIISKLLRIPPKSVQFAGTKDRRGVTVQEASIQKIKVERLNGLNKGLRGVKLGSFKYADEPLRLGDLKGNEFMITIRDVDSTEHLDELLNSLKANGFINYFGMQRFGTFSVSTHTIGKHILNGKYENAVELILSPQELALPASVEARQLWADTRDAAKAFEKMPKKCVAESAILRSLSRDPKGHVNAVMQVPRNLRVMYVHAYQSYIWNNAASFRIKKYGMKVVPGDLVIEEQLVDKRDEAYNIDEDVKETHFVRARVVTDEDIKTMTIFDVVLPTPGYDIIYPENEVENIYRDLMAADDLDYKKMQRNIKEFSLSGSYRNVVAKPAAVDWSVQKYSDATEQLVRTDFDILENSLTQDDRIIATKGDKTAVVLKLQLGSSTYATMALREVMKVDTSRRGDGLDVKAAE